jgi:DNA polymerase
MALTASAVPTPRITGKYLAKNRLSDAARTAIALRLLRGDEPPVTEFAVAQVARLCRIPRSKIDKHLKRHRNLAEALARAFKVLCCAYAVDDQPVQLWTPGNPVPPEFIEAANNPNWIVAAHGDHFESAIEHHIMASRFGWPLVPLERHVCTMARALSHGLPARLSAVADALELINRKDAGGERLMHQMAKPRRARKDENPGIYWFDDNDRLQRLYEYCRQDVEVEREIYNRVPALSIAEQALWILSCTINSRGFCVDRKFAEAARKIVQAAGPEIDLQLTELTGGAATKINQVAKILAWLQARGCKPNKLDRKTIEYFLEKDDLPSTVRQVFNLRLDGAQAATKKINALLARAGDGDRVRGAFRFHGAATGRWAGEGFQPHNLKRPVVADLNAAIAAVSTGDYQHVRKLYERPLSVVGDCSRSMIIAAPGHTLIGADFGAVESRSVRRGLFSDCMPDLPRAGWLLH